MKAGLLVAGLLGTLAGPAGPACAAGELRVWAAPADAPLLRAWEAGYRRLHPDAALRLTLHGPESPMMGVYTGVADFALLAREMRQPAEFMAFTWALRHPPTVLDVANAGADTARPNPSLAVFVNRRNPLDHLTLAQLDAIFGAEHRRGPANVRRWDQVGLGGDWDRRPIHVLGPAVDSVPALFFRRAVLEDSYKWNAGLREFDDDRALLAALAQDENAIAYGPLHAAPPGAKAIALAPTSAGPFVSLTPATVVDRTYPLARAVSVVLDHPPNQPLNPATRDFLRYVLSADGQAIVAREGSCLPLDARTAAEEAEKLGGPPADPFAGTIRIWGHGAYANRVDFIEGLVSAWEDDYRKLHPAVVFENHLSGTAAAIGALCANVGDLALMGREIWPYEVAAFREVHGYPPTGLDVLTGSLETRNRDFALAVFVHRDNPITQLTFRQLDALFSADRRRGGAPVRTWGDLGLTGAWKDRPVHLYGWPIERGFAEFFAETVFAGGRKWNPALREFTDSAGTTGGEGDGGQKVTAALAADPDGIAYSSLLYRNADVKAVALAAEEGGPAVAPSRQTVLDHSYPLTRYITIFLDRPPDRPADPKLAEFLRYVLSPAGQARVADKGKGYLPIVAPFAEQQLQKLSAP